MSEEPTYRENLLDEMFEKTARKGKDALRSGPIFNLKQVDVEISKDICAAPFPEDFRVTLQELTGAQEASCADTGGHRPMALGYEMAKSCMYALNGAPLDEMRKAWLWEALGMGGRRRVVAGFALAFSQDDTEGAKELLGKLSS